MCALCTAGLALVYSSAEYCSPVWGESSHTIHLDTVLKTLMQIISGTLNSTLVQWLMVLSTIPPPVVHRKVRMLREFDCIKVNLEFQPMKTCGIY